MSNPPEVSGGLSTITQGRSRRQVGVDNRRITEKARQRVYRLLADRHRDEYRELLEAERRAAGYVDLPVGRPKKEDQ